MAETTRTVLAGTGQAFEDIKGSRFWGYAAPVSDESAAKAAIAQHSARHPDATALAYAYTCGEDNGAMRFSDGGEPGGTAGLPMAETLRRFGVRDAMVVVARIYGGTKLGAGGLARAFSGVAAKALADAGTAALHWAHTYAVTLPYTAADAFKHAARCAGHTLLDTEYTTAVVCTLQVWQTDAPAFAALVRSHTKGGEAVLLSEGWAAKTALVAP